MDSLLSYYHSSRLALTIRQPLLMASSIFLLVLAILLIPPTLHLVPSVRGTSRTISLIGDYIAGWNGSKPGPTITVVQGDMVTTPLSSGDGFQHQFLVDVDRDGYSDCSDADPCSPTFMTSTGITYPFTVTFPPGTYAYYCTFHSFSMYGSFVVQPTTTASPDFTIIASPTSLNIAQGSTATTTITLTSVNSFSGTISITGDVVPSGPSVSFSPTSVALSGGSTTSTLTVSAVGGLYSSVANGNYSVNVTANSGSLFHSTTVKVTVGSSNSSPSGSANLPLTVLVGAAVVVIAAVAVTVFVLRRKSK